VGHVNRVLDRSCVVTELKALVVGTAERRNKVRGAHRRQIDTAICMTNPLSRRRLSMSDKDVTDRVVHYYGRC
jgi:hypothetical protein